MAKSLPKLELPKLPALPFDLSEIFPSFFPSKDILGIDIGNYAIKLIQLKKNGTQWKVSHWIQEIYAGESLADISPAERNTIIVSTLKRIINQEKITVKKAAVSVCGSTVIVRYVKFPRLTTQELSKTINFEAEPYIPFAINDVYLGFQILRPIEEEGQRKMETILVAAKREVVQNRIDIIREAGLYPMVIDVDAFALENALEIGQRLPPDETVVGLNIGATITNLAIIENGVSRVVRDIFIAGNTFTKAIQRNLGTDYTTAEELKKLHGVLLTPEEQEVAHAHNDTEKIQVSQCLLPIFRDLSQEIQRSLDYYQAQTPDKNVTKIYLTGGSVPLPNLVNYLAQELHLPIEIYYPQQNIVPDRPNLVINKETSYSYAIACGLAMRRYGDNKG